LLPRPQGLSVGAWRYFAIFAAVLAALMLESAAPGAVGLVGLTLAAVLGCVDPDPARSLKWMLSGFSEGTVWLIVGAYVFSIGYRKSGLGRRIALWLVKALGRHTLGLGYAVVLADLVLAPATPSNTARSGGIIYPIAVQIPRLYGSEPGPTAGKIGTYLMWTAFAGTAVTSSMFLTALAPNAAALAIVHGTTHLEVSWWQWLSGFLPVGTALLLLVPLLAFWLCRPEVKHSPEISAWAARELAALGPTSRSERVMAALVALAMLLWVVGTGPGISLPVLGSGWLTATTVVFVVVSLMLVTGVVEFTDVASEKAAWEVFFYFTSLLTLASGLAEVGFIKWLTITLTEPLSALSPALATALLVALFFWVHYFFSSITSHAAAVLPVVLAAGAAVPGLSLRPLALVCLYSLGLMGVLSPYATGPAPMYFGSGFIGRAQFWRLGLTFGLVFFVALLGGLWPLLLASSQ
jgi:citrate:succinate antiporter/L-tartrate/succinate antiporter